MRLNVKQRIIDFYCDDRYLAALAIAVALFWATGQEIAGTVTIVLSACIYMWIGSDLRPVVSTVLLITMVYSLEQIKSKAFIVMVAILVPIIVASFVYNLFHFRKQRRYVKGKLYYPMAIAFITALAGGLFFDPYDKIWSLVVMGVGAGIYLLYFLCLNCVCGDKREIFAKILFYGGLIVCFQILIWFCRQPDLLTAVASKRLRVGWGMSNTIALVLVMAAPAAVYLGIKKKAYSFAMYPVLVVLSVLLLMTLSRGNILFGLPVVTISCIVGLIKGSRASRIAFAATAVGCVVCALCALPMLKLIAQKLFYGHDDGFFDNNGRLVLYEIAMKNFCKNPLFGVGYFKYNGVDLMLDSTHPQSAAFLWKVHNTIFQILACNGLIGVAGLMPYFAKRYNLLLDDLSLFKFLALLALVAYECEGMVDVAFLSVHELFFIIGLLAAAEWESEQKRTRSPLACEVRSPKKAFGVPSVGIVDKRFGKVYNFYD